MVVVVVTIDVLTSYNCNWVIDQVVMIGIVGITVVFVIVENLM